MAMIEKPVFPCDFSGPDLLGLCLGFWGDLVSLGAGGLKVLRSGLISLDNYL